MADRLIRLGVDESLVDAEVQAMEPVLVAKTCDRSVLGSMNDFAAIIPNYLADGGWDDSSLHLVEAQLAETPCRVTRSFAEVIFPDRKARELLVGKWGS